MNRIKGLQLSVRMTPTDVVRGSELLRQHVLALRLEQVPLVVDFVELRPESERVELLLYVYFFGKVQR